MSEYDTKKEQTRLYLTNAFIFLLKTTPIHRINVSQLTKKAGISRGTFYLHYIDIDDFIKTTREDLIEHIKNRLSSEMLTSPINDKVIQLVHYVEEHFELFQSLLGYNGDRQFEAELTSLIRNFIFNHQKDKIKKASIPDSYIINLTVMSILAIFLTWLQEKKPRPSEEIIAILFKTRHTTPFELIKGEI
ncbi:TetR/AcrR family transcriptional regulator [Streptococcus zalophi]|uniref:TetR family transcriptional regulator C-terminal domain-containing protein n=1 Tax=Streptococcus zalophi TaxID=640031 RepID=A0A934P8W1_9STRE|nr:TetR-like C-terminal domain-containing protein [Streptococcus zalophi]MBJ8349271.1 TetR family transcriptional regulator C-terminal domain-containing protein [Streptococcus zalophi]MCR8967107.1 TetR family transcriptional regulator C-terminal domain-containing protein [Streptococcus zalophi]